MKKLICALSLLLFCPLADAMEKEVGPQVVKRKKAALRIATYNIRRQGKEDKPERMWDQRRQLVVNMIKNIDPNILGLQEPIKEQVDDLVKERGNYDWFGQGRSDTVEWWQVWNKIGNRPYAQYDLK